MRILNEELVNETVAGTATSALQPLDHMYVGEVTASITAAVPANADFAAAAVSVANDTATIASHGYYTGLKVQVSNPGTLPTGITAATDYYIIRVDADTVKFATSQANALAGTAVNITGQGVGTNTVEVNVTIAGAVKLQKNNAPERSGSEVWVDLDSSSEAFTGTSTFTWMLNDHASGYGTIGYRSIRAVVTVTSGQVAALVRINAKGA